MPSLAKMKTKDPAPCRGGAGEELLKAGCRSWRGRAGKDITVALGASLVSFQALNNLQSTFSGFGYINSENVFKVPGLGEG